MPRPISFATQTAILVNVDGEDGQTPYSYQRIFLDDGSTTLRFRDETGAIIRPEEAIGVNLAAAAGFDYTVSDGRGGEDTACVDVTVEATNRATSIDAIATQTVAENSAVGATVLTASATDPDGDTLGYSLGGADDGAFAIDASSGKITPAVSPDFEAQADADGARLLQERLPRWVCNDTQCGTSRCRSGSRPPNKGLTVVASLCREISMLVLRPEPRAGLILP